ncbi:MAG: hypothetical protein MN733_20725 [Nitrososphaera sp.]|nr:hypothetical protein [Nitrososphaera sp.]
MSQIDTATTAVDQHFTNMMTPDILQLTNLANYDLYHGPLGPDDDQPWPGFAKATTQLSDWAEDNLCEVWYDTQSGEVLLSEPEGHYDEDCVDEAGEHQWVEPLWDDYYHFDYSEVKRAVFGKELAQYF